MNKILIGIICTFLCLTVELNAQEISCKTIILDNQIQLTDKKIFRTLEQAISEFVNNIKWTNDQFQPNERIELTIQFIPTKYEPTENYFEGSAQIICQRPTYGSTYTTPTLNFLDEDWKFTFAEFQRMDYNENSFTSNLVALVSFYVNYAIGLDYDSFSPMAGTPYFNKALTIANSAQSSDGSSGWKPFQKSLRTRYNLIDNILNSRFESIRQAYYKYHREGMDEMYKDPETGRKAIFESLELIQKIFKVAPNSTMLVLFFEAKSDELVNIYKGASPTEKSKAIDLLSEINIANINKYEKIRG
ncbi:MAG: DUF4835 family protein [Bacteroidia bacterium]|nr:DUF4835 family protein [Bacteroidia bacterium]MCC7533583.1 DUF4835 family protein [Bacteroidia bacterium]MCZ2140078.1 DUF4835 family protein [Bacteroidia bacterium]